MKRNHFLLLEKFKNTESAQLCTVTVRYWVTQFREVQRTTERYRAFKCTDAPKGVKKSPAVSFSSISRKLIACRRHSPAII